MIDKYCPNCLELCTVSPYARDGLGFGCDPCGILLYSSALLLDSPDKEAQKKYKLKEYIKSVVGYHMSSDAQIEEVISSIKSILAN